jgi:hypothetical protein
MADGIAGLVVTDEDQKVAADIDRVEFDGGERGDSLLVDGDLWREMFGMDPSDDLALELFDEVFGGEFTHVTDSRESLDQDRLFEVGVSEIVDLDFVHGAIRGPAV